MSGRMSAFEPSGVIPACLLPFDGSLAIDEPAYRRHLRDVASVAGISAITINGHASEVHALTFEEQRRVLEITRDELGSALPIVQGVYATASGEGARIARMAAAGSADALLVFPPASLGPGGESRPEMAHAHLRAITDVCDLPLIVFQYPTSSGLAYPLATLLSLSTSFPTIRAIKDWCGDPALHERHIRELHALPRPVRVLSTHSAWLLGSLVLGCDGLLSGAGSVIADLQVALWQAVQAGNLRTAQAVSDRIYPTTRAFYADPMLDMHNRMKEALVHLGRMEAAHVRPPLVRLSRNEVDRIAALLDEAGIRPETVYRSGLSEG